MLLLQLSLTVNPLMGLKSHNNKKTVPVLNQPSLYLFKHLERGYPPRQPPAPDPASGLLDSAVTPISEVGEGADKAEMAILVSLVFASNTISLNYQLLRLSGPLATPKAEGDRRVSFAVR
ncbi:unnamed protein product [Dibothriocephalus latus]|uniref:Uncharacterized protein n=1 Tax=Dibothriocephalus latus TaxID=60516 RepID=A0A3P7NKY2_DIBLA|nr:unnamed protein product [Dibothriocephalus latus]